MDKLFCPEDNEKLERDLNFPHIAAYKCRKCGEVWVKLGTEPLQRISELRKDWP